MVRIFLSFGLALSCAMVQAAEFQVRDVTARQRFPWNGKVDVDFMLDCDDSAQQFAVSVQLRDVAANTNLTASTFRCNGGDSIAAEFSLSAGAHRITWDADADASGVELNNIEATVTAKTFASLADAPYLVIDVSGGTNTLTFPITALSSAPADGWSDEYKTTKIVLRRCPAGEDPLGRYTLTKDFYAGVFEITQEQWRRVKGRWSKGDYAKGIGDKYPAYNFEGREMRGSQKGMQWPTNAEVEASSFIGILRAKTGIEVLDLPTHGQWEYACRAGATTKYYTGDTTNDLANAGWYCDNNTPEGAKEVGLKIPNAWGLYDMHGNVREWCLDWSGDPLTGEDPVGKTNGSTRVICGGGWDDFGIDCQASTPTQGYPFYTKQRSLGMRLFSGEPAGGGVEVVRSASCSGVALNTKAAKLAPAALADIVYDAAWAVGGHMATVRSNGKTIVTGARGVYPWDMACATVAQLDLSIMSSGGAVVSTISATLTNARTPAIAHTPVVTKPAVLATATTDGLTEEIGCAVCGEVISAQTVVPAGTYTLPQLPPDGGAATVSAALADAADAALKANVTTPEEYADFRAWALGAAGVGAQGAKTSPVAWLSYALGQSGLIAAAPETVSVAQIAAPSASGGIELLAAPGTIVVGNDAKPENLAKTFWVEGAADLGAPFSRDNVDIEIVEAAEGKVKIRFTPRDAGARSFFVRAVMGTY